MTPVGTQGRTRLVGFGLLAATFLVGALAGAAVDRVLSAEESADRTGAQREGDDDDGRSYVIDAVEMEPQQRAAIDAILKQRSKRMRSVWREAEPRLDAITDSARSEIMQVLSPEQRAEYERKLEERRKRRHGDRDGDRDGDRGDRRRQDGNAAPGDTAAADTAPPS